MQNPICTFLIIALIGTAHADEIATRIPAYVITDPAPDPVHPPHSAQVLVPSHGLGMNALFYLAGGAWGSPGIFSIANVLQDADAAAEVVAHRKEWNFLPWANDLTHTPLLVIGASRAYGEEYRRLADAVAAAGGKVTAITIQSDHSFQDHRITLAGEIVAWLQKLPIVASSPGMN